LRFNHLYLAPNKRDARMIWAKYESSKHFKNFAASFNQTFDQLSIPHQNHQRPIPHITLARFKTDVDVILLQKWSKHILPVHQIVIWESIPKNDHHIYIPIKKIALGY